MQWLRLGIFIVCSRAVPKTWLIDVTPPEALQRLTCPLTYPLLSAAATPSHGLLVVGKFELVAHLDRAPPALGRQGAGLVGQYHRV
jgi:hypothetical protein